MFLQKKQHTVTRGKEETDLIARGRHDPCVVPRGMFPFFYLSWLEGFTNVIGSIGTRLLAFGVAQLYAIKCDAKSSIWTDTVYD